MKYPNHKAGSLISKKQIDQMEDVRLQMNIAYTCLGFVALVFFVSSFLDSFPVEVAL